MRLACAVVVEPKAASSVSLRPPVCRNGTPAFVDGLYVTILRPSFQFWASMSAAEDHTGWEVVNVPSLEKEAVSPTTSPVQVPLSKRTRYTPPVVARLLLDS